MGAGGEGEGDRDMDGEGVYDLDAVVLRDTLLDGEEDREGSTGVPLGRVLKEGRAQGVGDLDRVGDPDVERLPRGGEGEVLEDTDRVEALKMEGEAEEDRVPREVREPTPLTLGDPPEGVPNADSVGVKEEDTLPVFFHSGLPLPEVE